MNQIEQSPFSNFQNVQLKPKKQDAENQSNKSFTSQVNSFTTQNTFVSKQSDVIKNESVKIKSMQEKDLKRLGENFNPTELSNLSNYVYSSSKNDAFPSPLQELDQNKIPFMDSKSVIQISPMNQQIKYQNQKENNVGNYLVRVHPQLPQQQNPKDFAIRKLDFQDQDVDNITDLTVDSSNYQNQKSFEQQSFLENKFLKQQTQNQIETFGFLKQDHQQSPFQEFLKSQRQQNQFNIEKMKQNFGQMNQIQNEVQNNLIQSNWSVQGHLGNTHIQKQFEFNIEKKPNNFAETYKQTYNIPQQTQMKLPNFDQIDDSKFQSDMIYLLENEQKNLGEFKARIEGQKMKVAQDFQLALKEIQNIFDEANAEVQQKLDNQYRETIRRYKEFKNEQEEFQQMEKDLTDGPSQNKLSNTPNKSQNDRLIQGLHSVIHKIQTSKVYLQIEQLYFEYRSRMSKKSLELVEIIQGDKNYYLSDQMQNHLDSCNQQFKKLLKQDGLTDYVKSVQQKLEKPFQDFSAVKGEQSMSQNRSQQKAKEFAPFVSNQTFEPHKQSNYFLEDQFQNQLAVIQEQVSHQKFSKPQQLHNNPNYQHQPIFQQQLQQQIDVVVSQNNLNTSKVNYQYQSCKLFNITQTEHSDLVLCFTIINDTLVTGSRDCTIKLYDQILRTEMATLQGHTGSICSLLGANIDNQNYVISGSDHGDCSVRIWDLDLRLQVQKLEYHTAAVVALEILGKENLVTGSYDKSIIIWNIYQGIILQQISAHQSSITNIKSTNKGFISVALDNCLNVWEQDQNGQYQLNNQITNNDFFCSLNISKNNVFAGSRDGFVKIYNLENLSLITAFKASEGPIVEILTIEDQQHNIQILTSCINDENLKIHTLKGLYQADLNLMNLMSIEYGCGVGPKVQFFKGNNELYIAAINQSQDNKIVSTWKLQ